MCGSMPIMEISYQISGSASLNGENVTMTCSHFLFLFWKTPMFIDSFIVRRPVIRKKAAPNIKWHPCLCGFGVL